MSAAERVLLRVYVPGVADAVARVVERDGQRLWRSWVAVEGVGSRDRPEWVGATVRAVREVERHVDDPEAGWALVPHWWNVQVPMTDVLEHLARGDRKMVHHPKNSAQ